MFKGYNPPDLSNYVPFVGATADVNLGVYDLSARALTLISSISEDILTVQYTGFAALTGALFRLVSTNTTDPAIELSVGTDYNRAQISVSGKIEWGGGLLDVDTNLYRSAANTLKTDDNLLVVGTLGAGAITHTGMTDNLVAYTGTHTIADTEDTVTESGTYTVNLLTAVGRQGKVHTIKNIGTGVITIDADGTETIDGALTYVIRTTNSGVTIISDGTNWLIKGVF